MHVRGFQSDSRIGLCPSHQRQKQDSREIHAPIKHKIFNRDRVRILFHGQEKGVIIPVDKQAGQSVKEHPFFGMDRKAKHSVEEVLEGLRGGRYNAL